MVFKIKINSTSAENINANFVENPRLHPKLRRKYWRFRNIIDSGNFENISKKKIQVLNVIETRQQDSKFKQKSNPSLLFFTILSVFFGFNF